MNITMIGVSNSGKTSYMSGLYEAVGVSRYHGFHITESEPQNTLIFANRRLETIAFSRLGYKFPDGTVKTTRWEFDLAHNGNPFASFGWIDYRGGILEDISTPINDPGFYGDVEELQGHILASNALMLFVDSILLTEHANIRRARRDSGIDRITNLLANYSVKYPNRNLTFLIVLSKADAVREQWRRNNYQLLLDRGRLAFSELAAICRNRPTWEGGIIAVSAVGEGNAETTISPSQNLQTPLTSSVRLRDFPTPMHVPQALFYCVGRTLHRMREYATGLITTYDQDMREALDRSTALRRFWALVTGHEDPLEIAMRLDSQRKEEYRVLSRYESYVNPLCMIADSAVQTYCARQR